MVWWVISSSVPKVTISMKAQQYSTSPLCTVRSRAPLPDVWETSGRRLGDVWETCGRRVGDVWETNVSAELRAELRAELS